MCAGREAGGRLRRAGIVFRFVTVRKPLSVGERRARTVETHLLRSKAAKIYLCWSAISKGSKRVSVFGG